MARGPIPGKPDLLRYLFKVRGQYSQPSSRRWWDRGHGFNEQSFRPYEPPDGMQADLTPVFGSHRWWDAWAGAYGISRGLGSFYNSGQNYNFISSLFAGFAAGLGTPPVEEEDATRSEDIGGTPISRSRVPPRLLSTYYGRLSSMRSRTAPFFIPKGGSPGPGKPGARSPAPPWNAAATLPKITQTHRPPPRPTTVGSPYGRGRTTMLDPQEWVTATPVYDSATLVGASATPTRISGARPTRLRRPAKTTALRRASATSISVGSRTGLGMYGDVSPWPRTSPPTQVRGELREFHGRSRVTQSMPGNFRPRHYPPARPEPGYDNERPAASLVPPPGTASPALGRLSPGQQRQVGQARGQIGQSVTGTTGDTRRPVPSSTKAEDQATPPEPAERRPKRYNSASGDLFESGLVYGLRK